MAWGSELVTIGEAGHINSTSGLGDWAQGLALLNILRKTTVKNFSGIARRKRTPRSEGSVPRTYSRGASRRNKNGACVVATCERKASTNTKNRSPQEQQSFQAHVLRPISCGAET